MSVHSRYRAGLWHPYEKPVYGVLLNPYHPLARGLVGCWLFNEGGGNTIFDLSGNFKHGAFGAEAPSWAAEGIYFGGDGDYIYTDPVNFESVGSIVAKVTPYTASGDQSILMRDSAVSSQQDIALQLHINVVRVQLGDNSSYQIEDSTETFSAYDTFLAAVTVDESNLHIYLNTTSRTVAKTVTPAGNNKNSMIGKLTSTYYYFNGVIHWIFAYNRCLQPSEIVQLYHDPFCMFYHPLEKELLKITGIAPLNIEIPLNCKSSSKLISKNSISKDCKLKDTYQKKYYSKIPFNLIFDSKFSKDFQLSTFQSFLVPLYISPFYYSLRKAGLIGVLKPSVNADNYYYAYPSWLSTITPLNVELSIKTHENFAFSYENTLIDSLLFSTSKYYVVGSVVIPLALGSQYISLTSILSADSSLSLKSNYKNFISSRFDIPLIVNPLIIEIVEQENILSFSIDNVFVPVIRTTFDSYIIQSLDSQVFSSSVRDLNVPINLFFNYISSILSIINFSDTLNVSSKMALENMIETIVPAILKDTYSSEYVGKATLAVSTDAEFVPLIRMIYEYSLTAPLLFSPILTTVKKAQALIKYLTIDIKKFNISIDIETIEQDG